MTFEAERENRKAAAQRAVNEAIDGFMRALTKVAVDFFVDIEDVVYQTPDVYPETTEEVLDRLDSEGEAAYLVFSDGHLRRRR